MRIIVGLGNPGEQHENTRHNAGFMAIDALTEKSGLKWRYEKKFNADLLEIPGESMSIITNGFAKDKTIFIKPSAFMNNSGQSVQAVLSYYKLLPKKLGLLKTANADLSEILTVIHDDLDIELGKYKVSVDSRSAGHRGVESIINHLKTKNFKRIRIGIKTPAIEKIPADKFVLQKFSDEEKKIVQSKIPEIIKETR